eukprot:scaffold27511_cov199-Amphora_coffeaeformis.AAC.3
MGGNCRASTQQVFFVLGLEAFACAAAQKNCGHPVGKNRHIMHAVGIKLYEKSYFYQKYVESYIQNSIKKKEKHQLGEL